MLCCDWLRLISTPKILAIVLEFLLGKDKRVQELCKLRSYEFYVSVNSNWVHPPGQPPGKFFWASESRPPGQNFLSNSLPRGKKWWSNSRGWGKIFPNSKKLLLKLAKKSLKNWENYETVQLFYLENLKKPLCFRLKQNNSKISLDIQLKYSV